MKKSIAIIAGVVLPIFIGLSAPRAQPMPAGLSFNNCIECPDMIAIPKGQYLMGTFDDPFGSRPKIDETPQHLVVISGFLLGKYEITQEQWYAVMGENPSTGTRGRSLPVEGVSWNETQNFIKKLNAKTGMHYRLPSEAEWEYAARAGSTTDYFFGEKLRELEDYAWSRSNSAGQTHGVGEKLSNPFGLYDIYGNVWEWVQDCYSPNYKNTPTDGSAVTSRTGCDRVMRGGSRGASENRSANRSSNPSDTKHDQIGFRLAHDAQ